jgi:hypothetical protein
VPRGGLNCGQPYRGAMPNRLMSIVCGQWPMADRVVGEGSAKRGRGENSLANARTQRRPAPSPFFPKVPTTLPKPKRKARELTPHKQMHTHVQKWIGNPQETAERMLRVPHGIDEDVAKVSHCRIGSHRVCELSLEGWASNPLHRGKQRPCSGRTRTRLGPARRHRRRPPHRWMPDGSCASTTDLATSHLQVHLLPRSRSNR